MLNFIRQIFQAISACISRIREPSGNFRVFREQMTAAMKKSTSTKQDVEKLRQVYKKENLRTAIDSQTRVASAVSGPQREPTMGKELLEKSRHSETAPRSRWTDQAKKEGKGLGRTRITKKRSKKLLNEIARRRGRARSLWAR